MSIMAYSAFSKKLKDAIKEDDEAYYEVLLKVIDNPERFTGPFRISNASTKLVQNVTQSHEIKFGNFMEDIMTEYIGLMNYNILDKNIGKGEDGNDLFADQIFSDAQGTVYLIEQKMRDDHDSTKKRGQYDNFRKKYTLLKRTFPNNKLVAIMWFADDFMAKNKNYYQKEAASETQDVDLHILYGVELFSLIFKRLDVWKEIISYIQQCKLERAKTNFNIPNFDTSPEMLKAIKRLQSERPKKFNKLVSNNPRYVQLREDLFPTGTNIHKVLNCL